MERDCIFCEGGIYLLNYISMSSEMEAFCKSCNMLVLLTTNFFTELGLSLEKISNRETE